MISTEKGKVSLKGGKPHHGWRLFLSNLRNRSNLFIRGLLTAQIFRPLHAEGLNAKKVGELSDVAIRSLPAYEMSALAAKGIRRWQRDQLEAVAASQMEAMAGEQLAAFVNNPNLTADQFERLIKALALPVHVGKISVILEALQEDPLEDRKIVVLADALLNELSRYAAQEVLVVFSRAATNRQFETLVEAMPFWFIQELSDHELQNPNAEEFERLDLRVEERQLSNSYRLMQLVRNFEAIELQHQRLVNGELVDIDPKAAPWRSCAPHLIDALRTRLLRGMRSESELREGDRILRMIKLDLTQKQVHLQTENCRVSGMLELWNSGYLDQCTIQSELLDKIVRPQSQLLRDMAGLLIDKGKEPDLQEEEAVALGQTLEQGCELADTIAPEIRKAKKLLAQLKSDRSFLIDSQEYFLDLIRHESRLGRFSAEFFRRLLLIEENEKVYHILHAEGFEELIVTNSQLAEGVALMKQTQQLRERVEELYLTLHGLTRELTVEDLSIEMRQTLASL